MWQALYTSLNSSRSPQSPYCWQTLQMWRQSLKSFTHKSVPQFHHRTHTRVKPHICKEFGKSFTQVSSLQTHHIIHIRDKLYRCKECDKSFTCHTRLQVHSTIHKVACLPDVKNVTYPLPRPQILESIKNFMQ